MVETQEISKSTPSESDNYLGLPRAVGKRDSYESKIIGYPPGYPRYSALLASNKSFQVWRRFSVLRSRLLLLKQDELSQLEEQLEDIDARDANILPIFLGSNRIDQNEERKRVLKRIDSALGEYDSFLARQHQVFMSDTAQDRSISNLQNWHRNNGSLAVDERAYLSRDDLFSPLGNNSWSERQVDVIENYFPINMAGIRNVPELLRQIIRVFQAALTSVLLFTPVIICNFVSNLTYRIILIVATTAIFIAILSLIARKRMKFSDLVIAGTTYATVLVVFISGANVVNN
ncbi:uncharacterized protein TrAtP1_006587 [Trichoderma atroviride]|uniref:uncharacterized protein n=1 Tax=Hypocrea atroviridis TaxID=63577 RepID=UPI003331FBFA|nr:hypothetical protein TrAtP1_006587 [Trichoderma atroviride]